MSTEAPVQIGPHHRSRLAIVYIRVAVAPSGPPDHASLQAQRNQSSHARAWGWPESAILAIEDIGRSGSSAEGRPGWQRLLDLVRQRQVGLVLVSDLSRLSRSVVDLNTFLRLCHKRDTPVAVNGTLVSFSTIYRRESSARQVARNAGSVAYQRTVREVREDLARYERGLKFFRSAGASQKSSDGKAQQRQVATHPDRYAREVMGMVAGALERSESIREVSENSLSLAKDLPSPAARLLHGVIYLLDDFEEACQEWQEREPEPPAGSLASSAA